MEDNTVWEKFISKILQDVTQKLSGAHEIFDRFAFQQYPSKLLIIGNLADYQKAETRKIIPFEMNETDSDDEIDDLDEFNDDEGEGTTVLHSKSRVKHNSLSFSCLIAADDVESAVLELGTRFSVLSSSCP